MVGAKGKAFLFKGTQGRGSGKTCTCIPCSLWFEALQPMDLGFYGSSNWSSSLYFIILNNNGNPLVVFNLQHKMLVVFVFIKDLAPFDYGV